MLFLGAAIGAAVQIGTSIFGAIQAKKAQKAQIAMAEEQMAKSNALREQAEAKRVDYKAPQELEENIAEAKADLQAGDKVVQSATEAADARVANIGAKAERAATSGSQLLASITGAEVEAGKTVSEAEITAEDRKARKKQMLALARKDIASSRDREYDVNVAQPYFQAISDARQLETASIQNQQGAINTGQQNAANMTAGIGKAGDLMKNITTDDFKGMFGGGKDKTIEKT
jgi:hypothetical protein